jgi:hypothetical protein
MKPALAGFIVVERKIAVIAAALSGMFPDV